MPNSSLLGVEQTQNRRSEAGKASTHRPSEREKAALDHHAAHVAAAPVMPRSKVPSAVHARAPGPERQSSPRPIHQKAEEFLPGVASRHLTKVVPKKREIIDLREIKN
jgi:hypothetical protein